MGKAKIGSFSIAGLVLGVVGTCISFIPVINELSLAMGVIAVICGIIALIKKDRIELAIAAIIIGGFAVVMSLSTQKALSEKTYQTDDDSSETSSNLYKVSGNSTDDILQNDASVIFGDFKAENGKYSTETKLTVNITNKMSENKTFEFTIEAVDANGNNIAEDYIYANDLNGGQSRSFDIFTNVQSDKIAQLKNAQFKIIEASVY